MSGPKDIEVNERITRKDAVKINTVVEKVAENHNYKIVKRSAPKENTLKIEAKKIKSQNELSDEKIQLEAKIDGDTIDLNIENHEECQEILKEIVTALGDMVKKQSELGGFGDTESSMGESGSKTKGF